MKFILHFNGVMFGVGVCFAAQHALAEEYWLAAVWVLLFSFNLHAALVTMYRLALQAAQREFDEFVRRIK